MLDVVLDGTDGDAKFPGDFLIAIASRHERHDVSFAGREADVVGNFGRFSIVLMIRACLFDRVFAVAGVCFLWHELPGESRIQKEHGDCREQQGHQCDEGNDMVLNEIRPDRQRWNQELSHLVWQKAHYEGRQSKDGNRIGFFSTYGFYQQNPKRYLKTAEAGLYAPCTKVSCERIIDNQ